MTDSKPERVVVGTHEIAKLADVEERTPAKWITRTRNGQLQPPFPDPDHPSVSGRPAWRVMTVEQWLRDSGRMDPEEFETAKGDPEC